VLGKKTPHEKCEGRDILDEAEAREVVTHRNGALKDLYWCMRYCEHAHWHVLSKDDMKKSSS
jgi:hypothetical protein